MAISFRIYYYISDLRRLMTLVESRLSYFSLCYMLNVALKIRSHIPTMPGFSTTISYAASLKCHSANRFSQIVIESVYL